MEQKVDIRWIQRYTNFHRACQRLLEVTEADRFLEDLSELEQEGLVQRFVAGPNGTLKMAFEDGLIADHDAWRQMMKARNKLTHVYDEEEVRVILGLIFHDYAPILKKLDETLDSLTKKEEYRQA